MNILITNDDGIHAEGIRTLVRALRDEHNVVVAAPDSQRSGAGHSLTLHSPLYAVRMDMEGLLGIKAYAVSGTPADCVKLAVSNFDIKPDLVVSGINMGANLGTDVFYSGTVAAAMEACIMGLPAIAMSICNHDPKHLQTAACWSKRAVDIMFPDKNTLSAQFNLLNVNVPDIPSDEVRGLRFVPLCKRKYPDTYDTNADDSFSMSKWGMLAQNPDENNDHNAVSSGFVAMTPLVTDMCDYNSLNLYLKKA